MYYTKVRDVATPGRAHPTDAGIDFYIPMDFPVTELEPGKDILIPSGIKVVVPKGAALIAHNKSGVAVKKKLSFGAHVVDESYRGEVFFHMYNRGSESVVLEPNMKIIQMVLVPILLENPIEITSAEYSKFENTARGEGSQGSTGDKANV
jgi:dUTP pyrophosphatase